ncbi:MAG: CidA/LrgA family protein [Hyphomicrobiales bacterium]|nr:MAG: CidA/LrgA family protein [Hyphomicrobiales bacterium]
MLGYLTFIFVCQLIGEVTVRATGLPVPGPVLGMVLLFLFLAIRGGIPDDLARTADGLLNNLSLLFVPAGVGVMLHIELIGRDLLPIAVALVGSTALTVAVTALLMNWLRPTSDDDSAKDAG